MRSNEQECLLQYVAPWAAVVSMHLIHVLPCTRAVHTHAALICGALCYTLHHLTATLTFLSYLLLCLQFKNIGHTSDF